MEHIDLFFVEENFEYDLNREQNELDEFKRYLPTKERYKEYLKIINKLKDFHEKKNLIYYRLIITRKNNFNKEQNEIFELGLKDGSINELKEIGKENIIPLGDITQNEILYKHLHSFTSEFYEKTYDLYSLVLIILKIEIKNLQLPEWSNMETILNAEFCFDIYINRIKMNVYNFMEDKKARKKFIEDKEDEFNRGKSENFGKENMMYVENVSELVLKYLVKEFEFNRTYIERRVITFDDLKKDIESLIEKENRLRII